MRARRQLEPGHLIMIAEAVKLLGVSLPTTRWDDKKIIVVEEADIVVSSGSASE